ncbi:MAG: HlyD family secretion protein [Dissulfurispiraceae bacterium]|nr:HlyD family secretion protein [Dissulfurispiraceae bacterium]
MTESKNNGKRKRIAFITLGLLIVICITALLFYLKYSALHISTDDAFIDADIHTVASKISGTVKHVYVKDNQHIKQGDLLLSINPEDYQAKVQEAHAALAVNKAKHNAASASCESAKKRLDEIILASESAKALLMQQQADLGQAERDMNRADELYKINAVSKERREQTMTAFDVAKAKVKAAEDNLAKALSSIETHKAVIIEAEAAIKFQAAEIRKSETELNTANLNQGYTKIYASVDGIITKRSVQTGNHVQPGQALMAVVPLHNIWITANYKETQLKNVKPGQKVRIKVDMYPDRVFEGKIDSIMAGTGAAFSLFPPENATGNYVKIVQRIPVKIVFLKSDDENILRVGMSVVPTILVK